ncbi:putative secreted protein (Por secretion system target) [Nonlabens dokdonensis]|jgi:hypothetical protein|uniref:Secretion system C-terminal sorting domain-containing protein n=2 Tax=Nonlabens dokdonensis TaxID=328515 RepID=L7WB55_NONDD|nr:T9SS type A sorting domain-containing protein [Nonlabens dokdonensis]AGC77314.1 hypothetical protein DDD_2187 [Nonlabens dokdonensis DSW-6]PZX40845.1 putative secreted protein (Por secretion system target) [Nonlabens dokdonensis]
MKKLYTYLIVFILFSGFIQAQNPVLTASDWFLEDLYVNGNSNLPSSINYITYNVELSFTDTGTNYQFETSVCPGAADIAGTFVYPNATTNTMTLQFVAQTLALCCDPNPNGIQNPDQDCLDLAGYSGMYMQFFATGISLDFHYDIATLGITNTTTLTITNPNGDYARYGSVPLSIDEVTSEIDVLLAANPVRDRLILKGSDIDYITDITIYDLSGKKLLNTNLYDEFIDIKTLKSGMYLLQIKLYDKMKTIRFIKE